MPDPTKPLKISDKKEFERRQQAYNDSLDSYNSTIGVFRDVFPGYKGDIEDLWDINDRTNIKDEELKNALNSGDLDIVWNKEKLLRESSDLGYKGIAPEWVLSSRGGTMEKFFFKKPTQPVEYEKPQKPSYQQIPIKQPVITPIQQSLDEELRTTVVPDAIKYPKDVQRFTAGNYLEFQGKPSGYINYGDNKGQQDVYQDGGVRDMPDPTKPIKESTLNSDINRLLEKEIPTRLDSLALLNNTNNLINFYKSYGDPTISKISSNTSNDIFTDLLENRENFKKNISERAFPVTKTGLNIRYPKQKNPNSESDYNKYLDSITTDLYYKKIDNNKFFQRESAAKLLNDKAPMALYDKRILPNTSYVYGDNEPLDITPSNYADSNYLAGDTVSFYGYDPLSVTPWDMLNDEQRAERIKKYGTSGTPIDTYQQIPTIEPTLEEIPLEELKTVPVQNAYVPPKDARRFTAGNYLESQGKPSGYVNYGDNTGRKDVYQDGGVVLNNDDRSIDSFYTDQQAKSLGFQVSYPYKTLQNPEYKDIRIPQQNPHFMEPLREKKIQYRQVPMNIEDGTSMLDNNNDIGFLFNKKFGI